LYLFFGSWFFSFYLLLFKTNLRENCDPFFKSTETYGHNLFVGFFLKEFTHFAFI